MNYPVASWRTQSMKSEGFSLTSALVASALLGIIATAMNAMIFTAMKGSKTVETQLEFRNLRSNISLVLSDPVQCLAALRNSRGGVAHFGSVGDVSATEQLSAIVLGSLELARVGARYSGATLRTLRLEAVPGTLPVSASGGLQVHRAQLILDLERPQDSLGSRTISNVSSPILMSITTAGLGAGPIVACQANASAQQMCAALGNRFEWGIDPGAGREICRIRHQMELVPLSLGRDSQGWDQANTEFGEPPAFFNYSAQTALFADAMTAHRTCQHKGYMSAASFVAGRHWGGHCSRWDGERWISWDCGRGGSRQWITRLVCIR